MVEFCPECSSLLRKSENRLVCKCGYEKKLNIDPNAVQKKIEKKKKALDKNLIIVSEDDKISVHPTVLKICPKCGFEKAEAWQEQTRSADEPSTSFFRCLNCKFTWREY